MTEYEKIPLTTGPRYPYGIIHALAVLSDALDHVADQTPTSDAEEDSHGRFYAERGLVSAQALLGDAITMATVEHDMSYDEALKLFLMHDFVCSALPESNYATLLTDFAADSPVVLKQHLHYPEDVYGMLTGDAELIPYYDGTNDEVRPVIIATVIADGVADSELIFVRRSERTGSFSTPGVAVGKRAVKDYSSSRALSTEINQYD